jgi:hypothetical protein
MKRDPQRQGKSELDQLTHAVNEQYAKVGGIGKKLAVEYFRLGELLVQIRDLLKVTSSWRDHQVKNGWPRASVWRAIRLYATGKAAGGITAIEGMTYKQAMDLLIPEDKEKEGSLNEEAGAAGDAKGDAEDGAESEQSATPLPNQVISKTRDYIADAVVELSHLTGQRDIDVAALGSLKHEAAKLVKMIEEIEGRVKGVVG